VSEGAIPLQAQPKLKTILAKKLGMTQIYDSHGLSKGATILQAGPCKIVQLKTLESDGYSAVQLGFAERREKNVSQGLLGHFKKAQVSPLTFVREVRTDKNDGLQLGQEVRVTGMFSVGDYVDVAGMSKGKGFAGGVKRWGFHGGPKTHGQSDRHRAPGSLTARRSLGRVMPGKKMAGHMGDERVTVQKLEVLSVDDQKNLLYILGAVPGVIGGYLVVQETVKRRKKKPADTAQKVSKKKQTVKAAAKPAAKK